MKQCSKILIASVVGGVALAFLPGEGMAENSLCFEEDEILADVLWEFLVNQAIVAQRCDALTLQAEAERRSGIFSNS